MSAVIDKPSRAQARRQAAPAIDQPLAAPFGLAGGRHFVENTDGYAWPLCDHRDVLDIDFDVREYRGEGMYLLHRPAPASEVVGAPGRFPFSSSWTGIRCMSGSGTSSSRRAMLDLSAAGQQWRDIDSDEWAQTKVLAKVHNIYRRATGGEPSTGFVGHVSGIGQADDGSAMVQFKPEPGRLLTLSGLTDDEARRMAPMLMKLARLEVTS